MTLQAIYTNEHYHQLFYKYLMDRFDGESEEVNAVIQTAEEVLPFTLGEYFGTGFSSIYELQDENEIEELRKKIKAHNVLKNLDRREEPRYTEVLKWYRLFVKLASKTETNQALRSDITATRKMVKYHVTYYMMSGTEKLLSGDSVAY